ncbi:unnamed protein product [Paramecium sonneborni]|uniref:Uncharacterized protein n=1 Tax=Paramecium sonneborni TaxID=65129 RepID=A0A8S1NCC4_9CILI|nr:unnamed protein product [Paramecium sonneborni]CAD8089796.1 unnamed protein product [Paramecium sonneborni]
MPQMVFRIKVCTQNICGKQNRYEKFRKAKPHLIQNYEIQN